MQEISTGRIPREGEIRCVAFKSRLIKQFKVERIRRVRSGAILAFGIDLETGRKFGIPVSKYAVWH